MYISIWGKQSKHVCLYWALDIVKVIVPDQIHLHVPLVRKPCTQAGMSYPAKFAPTRLTIWRKPIRLCCIAIELIAWKVLLALWTPFIQLIASHILCLARRYWVSCPGTDYRTILASECR